MNATPQNFRFGIKTLLSAILILSVLLAVGRTFLPIPAYIYASMLENSWSRANPRTMAELESHLSLYSKKPVDVSASEWAPNYELKDGERMIQYTILGAANMEVVYDENDAVITIITSYE